MTEPRHPALQSWPREGHVVVFDLEWTAWEGSLARQWSGPGEHRELIQIGAVRLEAVSFSELAAFECLVKPVRNPSLSAYITKLTGITDRQMNERGIAFTAALDSFDEFIAGDTALYNGGDARVLEENCALHGMAYPWPLERCSNIRPALARITQHAPEQLVSSQLPELLGCGNRSAEHSGLGDARAIAMALSALRARGMM